jgi:predicted acyl esterase
VIPAGHRIRLEVSSSNFPRFDRNTNTGGVIAAETAADIRQAVNRVHHTGALTSRLVLPVIRR